MESVLVNFRMPKKRFLQIREIASRNMVSVSEYIRNCVERELGLNAVAEREAAVWRSELQQDVRDLIGIAEGAEVDDRAERDAYHDYLVEKYS